MLSCIAGIVTVSFMSDNGSYQEPVEMRPD